LVVEVVGGRAEGREAGPVLQTAADETRRGCVFLQFVSIVESPSLPNAESQLAGDSAGTAERGQGHKCHFRPDQGGTSVQTERFKVWATLMPRTAWPALQ